jgi:multiple sugar transport system substrate-binding protein
MLMKYSKNQDTGKKFLRWIGSKEIFDKWFTSQQGYTCGPKVAHGEVVKIYGG